MKFPYRKLYLPKINDLLGSYLLKPIIPVKIVYCGKEINYAALIDSGADFSIFDAEIGEYLGIDIKHGTLLKFGGISGEGNAVAYLHEMTLEIGGWKYKTVVGFSKDIAKHGYGILGQKGFFDIFVVKFDLIKEEVELKERQ